MFKGLFQTKKNTPKAEIVWDLTDIDLNNIHNIPYYTSNMAMVVGRKLRVKCAPLVIKQVQKL